MSEALTEWVKRHVALLRDLHPEGITLDAVGEAVGAQAIGVEHIEALLDALEAEGLALRQPLEADLAGLLLRVLRAARALRAQGRSIAPPDLAKQASLSEREVRVALLYAHVLER
jgi:DNA-binding MarR family transcriptional regulator